MKFKMPVEHLRRIRKIHKEARVTSLGSIKYLPYSIYTLMSNIPMPWESTKLVDVLYHINGSIAFVESKSKSTKEEFMHNWHKINARKQTNLKCINFPVFEDDEKIYNLYERVEDRIGGVEQLIGGGDIKDLIGDNGDPNTSSPNIPITNDLNIPINNHPNIPITNPPTNPNITNPTNFKDYCAAFDKKKLLDFSTFERRKNSKFYNLHEIPLYANYKGINILKAAEKNKKKPKTNFSSNIKKYFKNTRFFQSTQMDWVEVGGIILEQGHQMLEEILRRKKLSFVYLDFNFNLKHTRTLTTKERKKSRLGVSFHLLREILKIVKYVVDAHVVTKLKLYSSLELCASLKNLFSRIGILTGIYRYKYKVMKQIKICKELDSSGDGMCLDGSSRDGRHSKDGNRDGKDDAKDTNSLYNNGWSEQWRVYVFMLRGYNSLLRKYLNDLINRIAIGRESKKKPLKKQRVESNLDLVLKREIKENLTGRYNKIQIDLILRHCNEAWRCWKADVPYDFDIQEKTIEKFVKKKSLESLKNLEKQPKNKKEISKRLGRITRLWVKEEKERQRRYLVSHNMSPEIAMGIYKIVFDYFTSLKNPFISFPDKNEIKHLQIALEKLKESADEKELDFYAKVSESPEIYIFKIKKSILAQRKFREIGVKVVENYNSLCVVYSINPLERLADAFLSSYLLYESDVNIFPSYFKPSDKIEMREIFDFCQEISNSNAFVYEGRFKNVMKNIEINLFSRLLKIFIDPIIVDYLVSRNNANLNYKDMNFTNCFGFLSGFEFSPFIYKIQTLFIDLVSFGGFLFDNSNKIKRVLRYFDRIYFLIEDPLPLQDPLLLHYEFGTSIPKGLCTFESLSLVKNKFSLGGVKVTIGKEGQWTLQNGLRAKVVLEEETLNTLKWRINQIVRTSTSCTFLKVITKWNTTISGFVNRYREAIGEDLRLFLSLENKIQNVVKRGINSKMPIRFPGVIFYTPKEYGGLGMYNVSGCISKGDNDSGGDGDGKGDSNGNVSNTPLPNTCITPLPHTQSIPSILKYCKPWHKEFEDSDRVWREFNLNGSIQVNSGIPRMSTLLQKNKISFYDRSFRLLKFFRKFNSPKYDPLVFTNLRQDGKLLDLQNYPLEMVEALGGEEFILRHTLSRATYSQKFDKVFWDDSYLTTIKTNTRAQKRGLSQIPNRRFILWWSPTINRANVYVGYQTQLEPTGIQMHGKLPTLKVSYLNLFRNNFWKKIHNSIVFDLQKQLNLFSPTVLLETPSRKSYQFVVGYPDLLISGVFQTVSKSLWIDVQLRWGDYDRQDPFKYAFTKYTEYTSNYQSKYPCKEGILLVFDLCHNVYGFYGFSDKKLEGALTGICEQILKNNASLHILRERVRSTLEIYTVEVQRVSAPHELFNNSLIVEDRLMFQSSRILFILDPETGNLYSKTIPLEEGKKPKHLRTLISPIVLELGDSLKKTYLIVKKELGDILKNNVDYPGINLREYENDIPFFLLPKVVRVESNYKNWFVVNLYKNWFGISKFTSFCRLILILQSIRIDPKIEVPVVLPDKEWVVVEREMKTKIVQNYCSYHVMNPGTLREVDVRDIVFGIDVRGGRGDDERISGGSRDDERDSTNSNLEYGKDTNTIQYTNSYTIPSISSIPYVKPPLVQIPSNLISIFCTTTNPNSLTFCLLVRNNNCLSLAFIPQYSTPTQLYSSKFIPSGFRIEGFILNFNNPLIVEELKLRFKCTNPILIQISKEIVCNYQLELVKEEGGFYVPEVWDYSKMVEFYYDDDLEYTLELGY